MARPLHYDTEQILSAARELFLERGPTVTTAEIAARAGCSEATVFRRFPTKERLFAAAVLEMDLPDWGAMYTLSDDTSLEEQLLTIAERTVSFLLQMMPRVMMMKSALQLTPRETLGSMDSPPPLELIRHATRLFDAARRRGWCEAPDPEVLARSFLGGLHHYAFTEVSGINDMMPMPRATYVRQHVRLTLRAIEPRNDP